MKQIEFFYDFVCPYAYLASRQIARLAELRGAELIYRPALLGGIFNHLQTTKANPEAPYAPNRMHEAKARLNQLDMVRYSRWAGSPINAPKAHPRRTVLALRAALASEDLPLASQALFDAYWKYGVDLEEPEAVRDALDGAGLDGATAVSIANQSEAKQKLRDATEYAIERGVFGVPSFLVDGNLYWGFDRMSHVAAALDSAQPNFPPPPKPELPARASHIEFWFDFSSPYAYLASCQIEALERQTGVPIRYEPFLLGALFKALGTNNVPLLNFPPAKQNYLRLDLERIAARLGVSYQLPSHFPLRSVTPLRLALASGDQIGPISRALFHAYWAEGLDIANPGVLASVLRSLQLPETLLAEAEAEPIKQRLREQTDAALSHGLCGAPSFRVGKELFWGQDKLPLVAATALGW